MTTSDSQIFGTPVPSYLCGTGMETKELARMLGHYRPTITRQNYEPYLPHKVQKDEDMQNEATQSELQQAANILDNLLKF